MYIYYVFTRYGGHNKCEAVRSSKVILLDQSFLIHFALPNCKI